MLCTTYESRLDGRTNEGRSTSDEIVGNREDGGSEFGIVLRSLVVGGDLDLAKWIEGALGNILRGLAGEVRDLLFLADGDRLVGERARGLPTEEVARLVQEGARYFILDLGGDFAREGDGDLLGEGREELVFVDGLLFLMGYIANNRVFHKITDVAILLNNVATLVGYCPDEL